MRAQAGGERLVAVDLITRSLRLMGVNRAVGYGVLARSWSVLAGPVSMVLIATNFSTALQGYYYTFSSLLAAQIFFELGLLTVLAQFASHEFARLSWGEKGEVLGEEPHRERFLDLLCKGVKWYAASSLLLCAVLVPAGWRFFGSDPSSGEFSWRIPWILAVLGVAGNLLLIPFYAVISGSGDVQSVNRREMIGGIVGSLVSWSFIASGCGLYAVPAVSSGTAAVGALYLARTRPRLVREVRRRLCGGDKPRHPVAWRAEVWPMQWKIALSWASGYFISQLFTPVLFRYQGAAVAGQMGMTLTAANALLAVCLTWMGARAPELARCIARREWRDLDLIFRRVMWQSFLIAVAGACAGTFLIWFLQGRFTLGERFLPAGQAALLLLTVVGSVLGNGFATYLRAHRREPLLWVSLAAALLQGVLTLLLGRRYSSAGVTWGYCAVVLLFCLPAIVLVWRRCKTEWHRETA